MFTFHETEGLPGMTWCLRFDVQTFGDWKDKFTIHLWEGKNRMSYAKAKTDEQKYIQDAYGDVIMEEPDVEGGDEGKDEDDHDPAGDVEESSVQDESEEESSDSEDVFARGARNEQLAVGYKDDLSFVTRGAMIGVFAHKNDRLRFRTAIDRVRDLDGKSFSPQKVRCVLLCTHWDELTVPRR
mgnify:CR=1 FL=1|jgi:hypothetical protein